MHQTIDVTFRQITLALGAKYNVSTIQGPDLQRILRQTYDSAALTPDLHRACELQAINKNHKLNLRKIYAKLRKNL